MMPSYAIQLTAMLALFVVAACSTSGEPQSGAAVATLASVGQGDAELQIVQELPAPATTLGGAEQPIAAADVLEVTIYQVPDLIKGPLQVDDTGRLSLPLVGSIEAAGKTVPALQRDIAQAYTANYLQAADVSVFVKESGARRVTVIGEVNRAGVYPLPPTATLLDALALAGDLSNIADEGKIFVYRSVDGRRLVANYPIDQIRSGARANPRLYAGDTVIAFASQSRIALQNLKEALGVASSAARLAVIP